MQHVKEVVEGRCNPYILPIGNNDALIVGPRDSSYVTFNTLWADRLNGDAFRVPLLEDWKCPLTSLSVARPVPRGTAPSC